MTHEEKLWFLHHKLAEIRAMTGLDSVMLITREAVGPNQSAIMLFSCGVDDTTVAKAMLEGGMTFVPDTDDVIQPLPDGRQRLQ